MKLKMFVHVRHKDIEIPLQINDVAIITYFFFRTDCYHKSFNCNSERYLKLNFHHILLANGR